MKTKNLILGISSLGLILLYAMFNTDSLGLCNNYCSPLVEKYQNVFLFFPLIFIFSLLTYRSETAFQYWWKFAKFGIPVTFLLIIAINLGLLNSPTQGSFGWGGLFNDVINFYASLVIYAIFIIGSLIQITRGYFATPKS